MCDDTRLIAAVAAGDAAALRDLFERHAPWIAARLRRALPPDAVEDVRQETFIAIWRGAGTYQGQGAAGAWLWGIARRQAVLDPARHPPGRVRDGTDAPRAPFAQIPRVIPLRSLTLSA